ncbi:MAG TPA: hypothetical protein VF136_12195, partial [Methylomirabilota bacterium]
MPPATCRIQTRLAALGAALVLLLPAGAAAQKPDSMVVIVAGTKQYHQPGCPLVAKAGSKVTVAKLSEARRRGLTAHDCEEAAGLGPKGDPNQVLVYTQDDDNKYHRKDCKELGEEPTSLTLEKAGQKYWPCPV